MWDYTEIIDDFSSTDLNERGFFSFFPFDEVNAHISDLHH